MRKFTGGPALSRELAWQALANLRRQQASDLAYFDCLWVLAVIMLVLVPIILLTKRSVAEKGVRVGRGMRKAAGQAWPMSGRLRGRH